jgi:2-dehydropantoate 2-reductase
MIIVSLSGIGAVTRTPFGVFLSFPQTRQMVQQVMQEVFNVAQAHGIALPPDIVNKTLIDMDGFPPNGTASMQRDIMDGRPSELEAQNGAVVRLGQALGVDTPLNTFIYHSLLPLELKARGQVQFVI